MSAFIDQIIEILLDTAENYKNYGLVVCKKTKIITVIGCENKYDLIQISDVESHSGKPVGIEETKEVIDKSIEVKNIDSKTGKEETKKPVVDKTEETKKPVVDKTEETKKPVVDKNGEKLDLVKDDADNLQIDLTKILLGVANEYSDIGVIVNWAKKTITFDDHQLGLKIIDDQIHLIKSDK